MNIQHLPRNAIRIDGGTQAREELNATAVDDYSEQYAVNVDVMPALKVYFDGSQYWLADGFHRYFAVKQAGLQSVDCDVVSGTKRDAMVHALGANSKHGLRRTNADKRKAVEMALADDELSKLSNRKLADVCGVSGTYVDRIRGGQTANVCTPEQDQDIEEDQQPEVFDDAEPDESEEPEDTSAPISQDVISELCEEVDQVIERMKGHDLDTLEVVGAHFIRQIAELKKNL